MSLEGQQKHPDALVNPRAFSYEELSEQEVSYHTDRRVHLLLEVAGPIWLVRPQLAVPIYGTSGNLYWPTELTHEEIVKRTA